jgi:hypothetical protein
MALNERDRLSSVLERRQARLYLAAIQLPSCDMAALIYILRATRRALKSRGRSIN